MTSELPYRDNQSTLGLIPGRDCRRVSAPPDERAVWILSVYGAEIFGFLAAAARSRSAARSLYARFSVELGGVLHDFRGRCDLRVFSYFVARRQTRAYREVGGGLSSDTRPSTRCQRPARDSRLSLVIALKRQIPAEDRELVTLRLDRSLTWRQIAFTSLGEAVSDEELDREAGLLRQRYFALRLCVERLVSQMDMQLAARGRRR